MIDMRTMSSIRKVRIKETKDLIKEVCGYRNNICPCEMCLDINKNDCIRNSVDKPCPCTLCNKY